MTELPTSPFINGRFQQPTNEKRLRLVNPADNDVVAEVNAAGVAEINFAVEEAHLAFQQHWRDLPPGKRTEILFNIAKHIRDNAERLAQAEMRNIGKPISDARDEIALGARVFEYYAGAVTKFFGHTIPVARGGFDFTLRQPMGAVAAIVPWNFPFPIACWKVAPALAAGNTLVLKPASQSPLTALLLGQIAHEAGLAAGALQVVPGQGSEIGDALATHPLVRKISFTGSTAVGSRIMSLASRDLKRVSLELGGKSPNIVFADAELDQAAAQSPMSVFANTGQDCCARSRIFVEKEVFDSFVERFVEATRKLQVGDPSEEKTQIGPMVSATQRKAVEDFIGGARQAKRRVVCGGGRPKQRGYYLEPTVLLDVERSDRVWCEEVFGPVVCIRPFEDEQAM